MNSIYTTALASCIITFSAQAQNPLFIPPTLSGTNFELSVQAGTQTFFPGFNTPTYGVNGSFLAPTLIFNKGDIVSIHVTNNLNVQTTMHWHGMHVPSKYDGGPHQIIDAGATWTATYEVKNDVGTYWYHPHGAGKTDLQVSKGLAGFIIVKDDHEATLDLPRTYGVDDVPLVVQSKAFDVLYQIAIATELDTTIMVNGTMHAYFDAPAQVVRFRILNGSSMRSYEFGFSNDMTFYQIGSDGGLLPEPISLTRVRLAPGERAEILADFGSMQNQTIYLRNFGSELSDGIYGAAVVGNGMASIPDYDLNPLNGADYDILQVNVTAPTPDPVTTIPTSLATLTPLNENDASLSRTFTLAPQDMMPMSEMVEGPFTINGVQFNMDSINVTSHKGSVEIWRIDNQTLIAHPFHIHDVQFFILDKNGNPPPPNEQGKKDVVLALPMETTRVIMKFDDFADDSIPYMYHCHMLHHEDDGMMGSFIVVDTASTGISELDSNAIEIFPNPTSDYLNLRMNSSSQARFSYAVSNLLGQVVLSGEVLQNSGSAELNIRKLPAGNYLIRIDESGYFKTVMISKE